MGPASYQAAPSRNNRRVRVANLRLLSQCLSFNQMPVPIRLDGQSFDAYLGTRTRICLLDTLFGRGWRRILDSNQVACEQDFSAPFRERGDLLVMISLTGWWGPSPVSGEIPCERTKIQRPRFGEGPWSRTKYACEKGCVSPFGDEWRFWTLSRRIYHSVGRRAHCPSKGKRSR